MTQNFIIVVCLALAPFAIGCGKSSNDSKKVSDESAQRDSKTIPQELSVKLMPRPMETPNDHVDAVAFLPKENTLAIVTFGNDRVYHVSGLSPEAKLATLTGRGKFRLKKMVFSAEGTKLVALTEDDNTREDIGAGVITQARVWNIKTGKEEEMLVLDRKWRIATIAMTQDGKLIGAGCPEDGQYRMIQVRDLRSGKMEYTVEPPPPLTAPGAKNIPACNTRSTDDVYLSPGGRFLVSTDGYKCRLWNLATGNLQAFDCGYRESYEYNGFPISNEPLGAHSFATEVIISADGSLLASVNVMSTLYFHYDSVGTQYVHIRDAKGGKRLASVELPSGSLLSSLAISSNGRAVAAGIFRHGEKSTVLLWEVAR